jgi:protein-tyrosine phosphatase
MIFLKNFIVDCVENIYCDSYQEIIPNLFLGNYNSAKDDKLLDKIYLVINCSEEIPFHSDKTKNFRVNVPDNLSLDCNLKILVYINQILPVMYSCYKAKKPILVHCRAGMHRSATVIACFLMKYFNFNKDSSIQYIKSKRCVAFFPGPNFDLSLELFYNNIKKSKQVENNHFL